MGKPRNPWATKADALPHIIDHCVEDPKTGCVFYNSGKSQGFYTYPTIRIGAAKYQVGRILYEFYYDKVPTLWLLHSCDNPNCVNPKHLVQGSQSENMQDMHRRWRHNGKKLSQEQCTQIRAYPKFRGVGKHLAQLYGVSPALISLIRKGEYRGDNNLG